MAALRRYKFKVDEEALAIAKVGIMEDIHWFAWYTLNDNLKKESKGYNKEIAKDLISSIKGYKGLAGHAINEWHESHCILALDDLRKQKKMDWNQYDSYQKHFWSLLQTACDCKIAKDKPLNNWLYNDTA